MQRPSLLKDRRTAATDTNQCDQEKQTKKSKNNVKNYHKLLKLDLKRTKFIISK